MGLVRTLASTRANVIEHALSLYRYKHEDQVTLIVLLLKYTEIVIGRCTSCRKKARYRFVFCLPHLDSPSSFAPLPYLELVQAVADASCCLNRAVDAWFNGGEDNNECAALHHLCILSAIDSLVTTTELALERTQSEVTKPLAPIPSTQAIAYW